MKRLATAYRAILLFCLLLSGVAPKAWAQTGAPLGDPSKNPTSSKARIPLKYGYVDAVRGSIHLDIPVGPALPGRVPMGFRWMMDRADQHPLIDGSLRPIIWPHPVGPGGSFAFPLSDTVITKISVFWEGSWHAFHWVDYGRPGIPSFRSLQSNLPSSPTVAQWMRNLGAPVPVSPNGNYELAVSADGTSYYLVAAEGNVRFQAVLFGDKIIYRTVDITPRYLPSNYSCPWTVALESHLRTRWGDHIVFSESYTQFICTPGVSSPTIFTSQIRNAITGESITLSSSDFGIDDGGIRPWVTSHFNLTTNFDNTTINIEGYPSSQLYELHNPLDPQEIGWTDGIFNWGIGPATVTEIIGGQPRVTRLSASNATDSSNGLFIVHPEGLREEIRYSQSGYFKAESWFIPDSYYAYYFYSNDPIPGDDRWAGLLPSVQQGETPNFNSNNGYYGRISAVSIVDDFGNGRSYLIPKIVPTIQVLNGTNYPYQFTEPRHITYILEYPTPRLSEISNLSRFRGVRLVHPSGASWVDRRGLDAYLFYSAAILQEQTIYGTGAPASGLTDPVSRTASLSGWEPTWSVVDRVTTYSNWELKCFLNPNGDPLMQAVNAVPTWVQTKVGDPTGNPRLPITTSVMTARDEYGPVQWRTFTAAPTDANTPSVPMIGSTVIQPETQWARINPVGASGGVYQHSTESRHWDSTLGMLIQDGQTLALGGSQLNDLRPGSGTSYTLSQVSHQRDALGRITRTTTTRGAHVMEETRVYTGTNPNPDETTFTVTGPDVAVPAAGGPLGKRYTYGPAPHYWVLQEQDKLTGQITDYVRNARGQATYAANRLGVVLTSMTSEYDVLGRLTMQERSARGTVGALTAQYTYDPNGRWMQESTIGDGRTLTTRKEYDAFGRLVKVTMPDGSYQTTQYDAWGQVSSRSPMLRPGQSSYGSFTFQYDSLGKGWLQREIDANGRTLRTYPAEPAWGTRTADGFSLVGVLSTVVDDRGNAMTEVKDLLGQRSALIDELGHVTRFTYDRYGNLASAINTDQTRQYRRNELGWLTSRTEPEEGTTTFDTFTLSGMPLHTRQTGRNGLAAVDTTLSGLTAWGMPTVSTATSAVEGTVTRQLSFDSATHVLLGMSETQNVPGIATQTITETYGYDSLYRLTQKTVSDGAQSFTLTRTLDARGNETTLTLPAAGGRASQTIRTGYDAQARPTSVTLDYASRGLTAYDQVSGTAVSTLLTYGNGVSTLSKVDRGELTLTQHAVVNGGGYLTGNLETNNLAWSAGGLLLARGSDRFEYDALQRLSYAFTQGIQGESAEQWFSYDRYGNRIQSDFLFAAGPNNLTKPAELLAWRTSYGSSNDLPATLTALQPGSARGSLSAGTVTGTLTTNRVYDNSGRLTRVDAVPGLPSEATAWTYDPLGRIVREQIGGATSTFLLDGEGLRFRRTKADGTVEYTLYGFNREPRMVWKKPVSGGNAPEATSSTSTNKNAPSTNIIPIDDGGGGGGGTSTPCGATITAPASNLTVFAGQAITFSGTSGCGGTTTWAWGDGTTGSTLASTTHAFAAIGTYTVTFTSSRTGYSPTTATRIITVVQPVVVNSFTASASPIAAGMSSTLNWNVSGADTVSISGIGTVGGSGSLTVAPGTTTTYTLTATNLKGSATASVSITVQPAIPAISSFTSSPAWIAAGQNSTLSWNVNGATAVTISGIGTVGGSGSLGVNPSATTTYTLSATNLVGTATAQVQVRVSSAAPGVTSFTASSLRIAGGQSTTLSWSVGDAQSLSIDGLGSVSGTSLTVAPSATSTYTLRAVNPSGTTLRSVTVTVDTFPPVIVAFAAFPGVISAGQSTTLGWSVNNAETLSLTSVGTVGDAPITLTLLQTTTYVLSATNRVGTTSQQFTVTVTPPDSLQWQKTLIYGFGQLLSEERPSGTIYIQSDYVGSPSLITDSTGRVIGRSKNLPYGERLTNLGEKSTRRYTNHEDQPGSAIYMQARTYLPLYGKFAQVDPLYDQNMYTKDSWNLYAYVTNNPVTHTDPTGQYPAGAEPDQDEASGGGAKELRRQQAEDEAKRANDQKKDERQPMEEQRGPAQTALTQATLEKIGFTVAQAKSLADANVTVIDLVAAVLTHEHRGLTTAEDSSAIQAAVIAVVNRTLDSAYMKDANKTGVSQPGVANNELLKVISDKGFGGQFRSLTGGAAESNRGFISDIILGKRADAGYGVAKAKLDSFGSNSLSGFRQIWDSPTHMRYDIGTRNSFHGSGAKEPSSKNPLIIGPHVYFEGP